MTNSHCLILFLQKLIISLDNILVLIYFRQLQNSTVFSKTVSAAMWEGKAIHGTGTQIGSSEGLGAGTYCRSDLRSGPISRCRGKSGDECHHKVQGEKRSSKKHFCFLKNTTFLYHLSRLWTF